MKDYLIKARLKRIELCKELRKTKPFESWGLDTQKRILIEESPNCSECGLSEWRGYHLTLELDHIDGNNKNNKRENLRLLCPNCHSQTSTFRGKKGQHKGITNEQMLEAYNKTGNVNQALKLLNLSKGRTNYKRFQHILAMTNVGQAPD